MSDKIEKDKKRNGRPRKNAGEKRSKNITVKYQNLEYRGLKRRANNANIPLAEYIRQASIHAKITPRLSEEENNMVRSLIGISVNLNQLTKFINSRGTEMYQSEIDTIITTINGIIKTFKK